MGEASKILLHACCGPCASACIERLRAEGLEPVVFYSNANIAPDGEYRHRRDEARRLAGIMGAEFVEDTGASHAEWREKVARGFEDAPEGGERCRRCFEFNLARAAGQAARMGIGFTTSLTVSPHKRSATVFEAGRAAGGGAFRPFDFKKRDGFRRSVTLAKEFGLYRQDYCGCEFSRRDREAGAAGRPPGGTPNG
ncbi:MAG: epoxyqueuosine reductase QueH [Kiritimatiellae bacterium]|nr:epoxyqueuosine reductase QueH [Kiritimatiellia bacterium]